MTQTTSPLIVHLTYRQPGRVRVALAVVCSLIADGFNALATFALTAGLIKIGDVS